MAKLVRLKPLDAKKGHVIRRFTAFSITFEVGRGWYDVPDEVAEYLRKVRQVPNDEDTPLAFDVAAQPEAEALEAAERKRAEERAGAAAPNVISPRDVKIPTSPSATPEASEPARRPRGAQAAGKRP